MSLNSSLVKPSMFNSLFSQTEIFVYKLYVYLVLQSIDCEIGPTLLDTLSQNDGVLDLHPCQTVVFLKISQLESLFVRV